VLPWENFSLTFLDVVGRRLASENKKLLARDENLLIQDNRMTIFSALPVTGLLILRYKLRGCYFLDTL